jgi:hypothetical protein
MSSLSRFRRSDIRIFELEKTRSHSAVIAGIDRRSKAIRDKDGETATCLSQYWMRLGGSFGSGGAAQYVSYLS